MRFQNTSLYRIFLKRIRTSPRCEIPLPKRRILKVVQNFRAVILMPRWQNVVPKWPRFNTI